MQGEGCEGTHPPVDGLQHALLEVPVLEEVARDLALLEPLAAVHVEDPVPQELHHAGVEDRALMGG